MKTLKNSKIYSSTIRSYYRIIDFTLKRNTYGWEGLGFDALQFTILFTSCLTLVFAAILETKSSMN